jgi:PAS domain S-box-containing protein
MSASTLAESAVLPPGAVGGEGFGSHPEWLARWLQIAFPVAAAALLGALGWTYSLRRAVVARTRALSESEERYRALVDHSPEAIFIVRVEPNGDYVYESGNPVTDTITGVAEDEMRGRRLRDFLPKASVDQNAAPYRRCVATGEPLQFEYTIQRPEGPRHRETTLVPLKDKGGRVSHLVGASRDITARRQNEAMLRQAQKMEAVGQLTGGIAHDFNNLLTVIIGGLEGIARGRGNPERVERYTRLALDAASRGAKLTQQLLAFSRRQALQPKVVDVNALLGDFADLMRRAAGEALELKLHLAEEKVFCELDPSLFEAAMLNLVVNARDASPDGGEIVIATSRLDPTSPNAVRRGKALGVLICVSDKGEGMAPDVIERAFEPFFTTKEVGKGTGLGLSMVYGFVQQSGGDIEIQSEVDHGTRICIYLPSAAAPLDAERPGDDALEPRGSERILLVEDNVEVRTVVASSLEDLGYRVATASSAQEALELLRAGSPVNLLFTDVVMPGGVSGLELSRQARRLRPDLKVLTTSGHMGRIDADSAEARDVPTLPKPYGRSDLAQAVRRALDEAERTPAPAA